MIKNLSDLETKYIRMDEGKKDELVSRDDLRETAKSWALSLLQDLGNMPDYCKEMISQEDFDTGIKLTVTWIRNFFDISFEELGLSEVLR